MIKTQNLIEHTITNDNTYRKNVVVVVVLGW